MNWWVRQGLIQRMNKGKNDWLIQWKDDSIGKNDSINELINEWKDKRVNILMNYLPPALSCPTRLSIGRWNVFLQKATGSTSLAPGIRQLAVANYEYLHSALLNISELLRNVPQTI